MSFEGVLLGSKEAYKRAKGISERLAIICFPTGTAESYTIKRFARPITFQLAPQELLPEELKDKNTLSI